LKSQAQGRIYLDPEEKKKKKDSTKQAYSDFCP
jgi:hypothetical protein